MLNSFGEAYTITNKKAFKLVNSTNLEYAIPIL